MDALQLLKNYDCWEEILNRVHDPKDLKSCFEVCLTFQEILREKKNAFMFSLVLPLIERYLQDTTDSRAFSSLLKCRLICKSWCNAIEKRLKYTVFDRTFSFNSGQRTERFLQKFATYAGNPFRGRLVTLYPRGGLLLGELQVEGVEAEALNAHGNEWDMMRNGQWETFHMRKLRQLVELFGNKMENVVVDQRNNRHPLAFCKNMEMILAHLPNLRSLGIDMDYACKVELKERNGRLVLTTYIHDIRVQALEGHGFEGMVTRLIMEKYARRLYLISVGDPSGFPEDGLQLSSLQMLTFMCVDASTFTNGLRQLQAPQLYSIHFKVTSNRNQVDLWPIDELFRCIEHLPILYLSIQVSIRNVFVGESGPISAEHRPHAESIQSLHLNFPPGHFSLNFLLYCPNLEWIYINSPHDDMEVGLDVSRHGVPAGHPYGVPELLDINELIQRNDYDEFYHSNIWDKLLNLEGLHLRHKGRSGRFTREEYDNRKFENGRVSEQL